MTWSSPTARSCEPRGCRRNSLTDRPRRPWIQVGIDHTEHHGDVHPIIVTGASTNSQPRDAVSRRRPRTGTRRSPYSGWHERQRQPTNNNAISAGRCASRELDYLQKVPVSAGGHAADYELARLGWHGRWLRCRVPGSVLEVVGDGSLASCGFACEPSVAYQSGTGGEAFEAGGCATASAATSIMGSKPSALIA